MKCTTLNILLVLLPLATSLTSATQLHISPISQACNTHLNTLRNYATLSYWLTRDINAQKSLLTIIETQVHACDHPPPKTSPNTPAADDEYAYVYDPSSSLSPIFPSICSAYKVFLDSREYTYGFSKRQRENLLRGRGEVVEAARKEGCFGDEEEEEDGGESWVRLREVLGKLESGAEGVQKVGERASDWVQGWFGEVGGKGLRK